MRLLHGRQHDLMCDHRDYCALRCVVLLGRWSQQYDIYLHQTRHDTKMEKNKNMASPTSDNGNRAELHRFIIKSTQLLVYYLQRIVHAGAWRFVVLIILLISPLTYISLCLPNRPRGGLAFGDNLSSTTFPHHSASKSPSQA